MRNKSSIRTEATQGMLVKEARDAHGMKRTELARLIIESGKYAGRFTNEINLNDQLMWAEKDSRGLMHIALDILAKAEAKQAAADQKAAKATQQKAVATKKPKAKATKVSKKSPAQEIALAVADRIESDADEATDEELEAADRIMAGLDEAPVETASAA